MAGVEGPRDITDCPRCGSVCLGASLLPCGHVICRPCLAFLLNLDKLAATCPSCSDIILKQNHADDDDGRSVNLNVADVNFLSGAMEKIGRDDILNQLVVERITSGQILCCEEHPRKMAAAVCADCSSKPMCTSCSDAHKSRARTKSHFLQEMNPRQRPYFNPRTRTQPRSHQQHPNSGAGSLLWDTPIPELPLENPTLDGAEVDENLKMKNENEVNLVQDLINGELKKCVEVGVKLLESETHISAVIAQLESRKRDMQIQHQLLMTYTSHLQSSASVTDVAQARRMLKRLRRVRADSQPIRVDSFETLTDAVENLQNNTEDADLDETTNSDLNSSDHHVDSVTDPSTTKSWFLRRFQWPSGIFRQTTPENINLPSNEHQPSSLETEGQASENFQPNTGFSSMATSQRNHNSEIASQIASRSGTLVLDSARTSASPVTDGIPTPQIQGRRHRNDQQIQRSLEYIPQRTSTSSDSHLNIYGSIKDRLMGYCAKLRDVTYGRIEGPSTDVQSDHRDLRSSRLGQGTVTQRGPRRQKQLPRNSRKDRKEIQKRIIEGENQQPLRSRKENAWKMPTLRKVVKTTLKSIFLLVFFTVIVLIMDTVSVFYRVAIIAFCSIAWIAKMHYDIPLRTRIEDAWKEFSLWKFVEETLKSIFITVILMVVVLPFLVTASPFYQLAFSVFMLIAAIVYRSGIEE